MDTGIAPTHHTSTFFVRSAVPTRPSILRLRVGAGWIGVYVWCPLPQLLADATDHILAPARVVSPLIPFSFPTDARGNLLDARWLL